MFRQKHDLFYNTHTYCKVVLTCVLIMQRGVCVLQGDLTPPTYIAHQRDPSSQLSRQH